MSNVQRIMINKKETKTWGLAILGFNDYEL